jgi:hypothetical protein
MAKLETWDDLPTRGQIKKRIDSFLREFHDGKLEAAFAICPAFVWTGQGNEVKPGLSREKLLDHLEHAVFQFLEEEVDGAELGEVEKWCKVITPPSEADYEDLALEVPGTDSEADDDKAKATSAGEVLANVHLNGEANDVTGRYALTKHDGKWVLAFSNFDVM